MAEVGDSAMAAVDEAAEDACELSVDDVGKVLKELEKIIDWYSLGTYLEVKAHILDTIERENPTIRLRMIKMLQHWLRTGRGCSWRKLVEALYLMGELAMTDNIRRKHLSLTTPVLPKYLSGPEAFVADASTRALLAKKNKQRLMSKFSLLVTRLSQRFEELSVNFVRLQTYLTTFGCEYERFVDDVLHQETLPQLFNTVSRHNIWDYLNFDLAGYLVEGFAKSDQMCLDLLADYQRDFTGYLLTTEIVHYIAAKRWVGPTATPPENIPSEELCSKLTVKLTIDITTHSLKYVEEVWKTLLRRSQLPKHTLLLWDIAESSLMITWLFPKSKTAELADAILGNIHELRLKRVYLVSIDEIAVYLTDLDAINIDAQLDWQDIYEGSAGEALVAAARKGSVDLVASLLEEGADVNNSKDKTCCTPLVAGCFSGSTELVKLLMERGADVNMRAVVMTPLSMALDRGHEDVAVLLIEQGADVNAVGVEGKVGDVTLSLTPLMVAAAKGFQHATKLLLEHGANINMKSENKDNIVTPLGMALDGDHEEVAVLLIEHGADVNAVGVVGKMGEDTVSLTPLTVAAVRGFQHATKLLLEHGANINMKSENKDNIVTPLGIALERGHEEVAALLIEHGADVNAVCVEGKVGEDTVSVTPLMLAAGKGFQHATKLLLERGADMDIKSESRDDVVTPLGIALGYCREEVAALLIEQGADVNAVGFKGKRGETTLSLTHLVLAAWNGVQHATKLLLECGAEIDKEAEISADGVSKSVTALMVATSAEGAKLLLDHGAQIDFQTSRGGRTALMVASKGGRYEIAELLLDSGAQVDLQDSEGKTALMHAITEGANTDKDTVGLARLLLQRGANPQLKDTKGKTALALAVKQGDTELIELLSDPARATAPRDTSQHTPRPRTERKKEPRTAIGMIKDLFSNMGGRSREVFTK